MISPVGDSILTLSKAAPVSITCSVAAAMIMMVILAAGVSTAALKGSADVVKAGAAVAKVSATAGQRAAFAIDLDISKTWHVYAHGDTNFIGVDLMPAEGTTATDLEVEYPAGHPALAIATAEALAAFRALVTDGENFVFTIRREAILFDEKPLSAENPAVVKLATLLFSRRINRLLIQTDVTAEDISAFVRCLALDPATIQSQGGIQDVLLRERVATIWASSVSSCRLQRRRGL